MKTLNEWAKYHGVTFVVRSAGVYTTGTVSAGALEELFAEAEELRRERDDLAARLECIKLAAENLMREGDMMAARLAEIERAEPAEHPSADPHPFPCCGGTDEDPPEHCQDCPDMLRSHTVRSAAPERADPEQSEQDDCSECGGSGWHKLSCSQRADGALRLPATRDAGGVVTVCQRPKLRAGDMRRTKSHGLQIRVQCMARDFDGRPIGRLVRAGRPVYGWRKPEELDEWDLHLLQRPDIAAEVAKEKTA